MFVVALLALGGTAQAERMPPPGARVQLFNAASDLAFSSGMGGYTVFAKAHWSDCRKHPTGFRCPIELRWKRTGAREGWTGCWVNAIVWPTGYRINWNQRAARCDLQTEGNENRP